MLLAFVIIFGIIAVIALVLPELVIWGLLFGIVPGVILIVAPTLFGYSAVAWLVEQALPFGGWPATLTGWATSLFLGFAFNQPRRRKVFRRFRAACQPDVISSELLALHGEIVLHWPGKPGICSPLCAALLESPGVTGVIQQTGDARFERWTLTPREPGLAPTLWPDRPRDIAHIRDLIGSRDRAPGTPPTPATRSDPLAIEAAWNLRLSTRDVLVCEPAVAPAAADWTITHASYSDATSLRAQTVTVHDGSGTVRLRRSRVQATAPALFLALNWDSPNPH